MRYQKIFRIGRLCAVGITLLQSIAGTAHAAEILTAEVVATPNDVTVEQGGSANFFIQVSASGQNQCGSTSTAKVMTTFSISAGGALSSNNLSSALNFSAPGSGGNCAVTWTGASTLIFTQNFCSEKAERKGERHR